MSIILYELQGKNDLRFSPYCWRSRMALLHKGLDAVFEPVLFSQKEKIEFSNQTLVPILCDASQIICDSWSIACYLDDNYKDYPTLFGDQKARSLTKQFNYWVDIIIHPLLAKAIMIDVFEYAVADQDKNYFRKSREKRFGMSLEKFSSRSKEDIKHLQNALKPLSATLRDQAFIAGNSPSYADYILFGSVKFALLTCPRVIFPRDGSIGEWVNRMTNYYSKNED